MNKRDRNILVMAAMIEGFIGCMCTDAPKSVQKLLLSVRKANNEAMNSAGAHTNADIKTAKNTLDFFGRNVTSKYIDVLELREKRIVTLSFLLGILESASTNLREDRLIAVETLHEKLIQLFNYWDRNWRNTAYYAKADHLCKKWEIFI